MATKMNGKILCLSLMDIRKNFISQKNVIKLTWLLRRFDYGYKSKAEELGDKEASDMIRRYCNNWRDEV